MAEPTVEDRSELDRLELHWQSVGAVDPVRIAFAIGWALAAAVVVLWGDRALVAPPLLGLAALTLLAARRVGQQCQLSVSGAGAVALRVGSRRWDFPLADVVAVGRDGSVLRLDRRRGGPVFVPLHGHGIDAIGEVHARLDRLRTAAEPADPAEAARGRVALDALKQRV